MPFCLLSATDLSSPLLLIHLVSSLPFYLPIIWDNIIFMIDILDIYFLNIFISNDFSTSATHFHRHILELVTWHCSNSESIFMPQTLNITFDQLLSICPSISSLILPIYRFLYFLSLSQLLFVLIPSFPD